jgi:type I restriction enzyme, R subunit
VTAMVRLNRFRMNYLDRFQRMIDEYNAGSVNVEDFFRRLMAFAQELNGEEKRAISEQLSEEELALFDLLTQPEPELADKEKSQVKKTARELLNKLKGEKLVLDWRKRQESRAQVRVTIEEVLDRGLPEVYTRELFARKTEAVFHHIYESYFGAGRGIYAAVM